MSAATRKPAPAAKGGDKSHTPAPAGRCSLRLRINGVGYRVRPVEPMGRDAGVIRAFRLKRIGADAHTIAETIDGLYCDCGDFIWRRDGTGWRPCKHLAAALACGLL